MLLHVDQTSFDLGTSVCVHNRQVSVYTGEINKYFLNWDFIHDPILFSFRLRQVSLYIDKKYNYVYLINML
jgi:hypothetical protein